MCVCVHARVRARAFMRRIRATSRACNVCMRATACVRAIYMLEYDAWRWQCARKQTRRGGCKLCSRVLLPHLSIGLAHDGAMGARRVANSSRRRRRQAHLCNQAKPRRRMHGCCARVFHVAKHFPCRKVALQARRERLRA